MRIGVVSDTHNRLPNVAKIVAILNEAGVARVVHTGDVTRPRTLEAFAGLDAPLHGVWGNNDLPERCELEPAARRLGFDFREGPVELRWHRRRILVVHDPLDLPDALGEWDLVLHGHTHRHVWESRDDARIFNPGECAGHVPGRNAVGVVDLGSLESELLTF